MQFQEHDIHKFNQGMEWENARFWKRLGGKPLLKDAAVLEIGSGWGNLAINMALDGTKKVVGLDLKPELVDFSNEMVKQNYPQLSDKVEFKVEHLEAYDDVAFDYIITKDTFEHITTGMAAMLQEMKKRLKPGGKIYTGFGPLYTSPYGDHDRRRVILKPWGIWGRLLSAIPWVHLFIEPTLVKMNNRYREIKIDSMRDLGLSKMSVSDYRKVFHESGLNIVSFRVNQSDSMMSKAFSVLRKIPFLDDYCTHSIYCIMEKRCE